MTREEACVRIDEAIAAYSHVGEILSTSPYGNGHINDTFLLVTPTKRYILQRINDSVFQHPREVMENVEKVTLHIKSKATEDRERATLTVVRTNTGDIAFKDSGGSYWRVYDFVEGTVAQDRVESANDFFICAEAFGRFQGYLSDFPAEELFESIKDFHNTPRRYENLIRAVERDECGRAEYVKSEIDFAIAHKDFCNTLEDARREGILPIRVTHNDTKLNNILFDAKDGRAVCVIDLDTVMPGYSVNDFGDSIRFGANTASEDETDLSKVSLDLDLFRTYAEGFINGCKGRLTADEISLLPVGAIMMTLECGMRFLTDYLEGDVYFKTHKEGHNLDRARNQFALVADMEKKLDEMDRIIADII